MFCNHVFMHFIYYEYINISFTSIYYVCIAYVTVLGKYLSTIFFNRMQNTNYRYLLCDIYHIITNKIYRLELL
jgi:hypothetical protein